jgi:hypothetical protein
LLPVTLHLIPVHLFHLPVVDSQMIPQAAESDRSRQPHSAWLPSISAAPGLAERLS